MNDFTREKLEYLRETFSDPFVDFLEKCEQQHRRNMRILNNYMIPSDATEIFGYPIHSGNSGIIVNELQKAGMKYTDIDWASLRERIIDLEKRRKNENQ